MRVFTILGVIVATAACWAADMGKLKTKVNPGRAGVFVDGKYVGPAANFGAARSYAVAPGEHEVRLAEPRYEELVTKVTVTAGKTTVLTQQLKALPLAKPPFGMLRVKNPDHFAAVYVNTWYMGHVDEFDNFAEGLEVPPGSYEVKIVPSTGGASVTKTITVEANKTVVVE